MIAWLSPDALDIERWRWRRFKGQHGGWNQAIWIELQEAWRRSL